MLDPRAQTLLKTLIERYIAEGQPVGSRTLSRYSGLELSPATIRNVMSDLRSSGSSRVRIRRRVAFPRRAATGVFVDTMLTVEAPEDEAMTTAVKTRLQGEEPQKIVAAAASVLSSLSSFAGRDPHAAPQPHVQADRVHAPVRQAHPAHHRDAGRRRPEPHHGDAARLFAVAAHRGVELHQRALRRLVLRRSTPPTSRGNRRSCAAT